MLPFQFIQQQENREREELERTIAESSHNHFESGTV